MCSFGFTRWKSGVNLTSTFQPTSCQYCPVVPNSAGFGLSQQYERATPMAAITVSTKENTMSPRRHFAHRFIERVLGPVRVSLWRPQVAAGRFLPERLILVYPTSTAWTKAIVAPGAGARPSVAIHLAPPRRSRHPCCLRTAEQTRHATQ
jgi:hypothetical protein